MVAPNCDAGEIGVSFAGLDLAYNLVVGDILFAVNGDVFELDDKKSVGTGHTLVSGRIAVTDALAEAAKLVGIRSVPDVAIVWVTTALAVFEQGTGGFVEDQHILVGDEQKGVIAAGGRLCGDCVCGAMAVAGAMSDGLEGQGGRTSLCDRRGMRGRVLQASALGNKGVCSWHTGGGHPWS